jgi:anti-anti-sigma factor
VILEETARGPVTVLSIAGEYDTLDVPKFTADVVNLIALGRVRIALSLEKLTFINSTALGSFIREHERVAQAGGELVCAALSKFTEKNFRLLGMDRRIPCFKTLEEAVAHLTVGSGGAGRVAFRFPDEGASGKERRAEVLEIRAAGLTFRLDDLEGLDPAAVFRPGRAVDLSLGGVRAKGKVEAVDSGAGRRLSVRALFEGLSDADRKALAAAGKKA